MNAIYPSSFSTFYDRCPWVVTWKDVHRLTTYPDNYIAYNTRLSREARRHGCDDVADVLKAGCGGITPSVWMEGGRNEKYVRGLTLVCISDTDHVGAEDMEDVKEKAYGDVHTLFGAVTNSERGVRVMYPWIAVDENGAVIPQEFFIWNGREEHSEFLARVRPYHDAAFYEGNTYYSELLGYPWDPHTSDINRMSFYCHDPRAVINPRASPFVVTPQMVNRFVPRTTVCEALRPRSYHLNGDENVYDKAERWVSRHVIYAEGSRNRYIVRCCLLLRDFGIDQTTCMEWVNVRFPDYETETRRSIIVRSVFQKSK